MPARSFLPSFLVSLSLLTLCPAIADASSWLDDVEPLISTGEREVFQKLPDETRRQEFVRSFWQVRDPFPQTERNELQESWSQRLVEARRRWGGLDDPRSRALLLRGEPGETFEVSCPGAPVHEVWVYEAGFGVKHRSVLIFLLEADQARLWTPAANTPALRPANPSECDNGKRLAQEAAWIRSFGEEQYAALIEKTLARPRPNPRDWYRQFASATPAGALPAPAMAALYAEEDAALDAGPGVRLLPPPGEVLFGNTRFEARVDGPISSVAFLLDGRRILTRSRPPYVVNLDLGSVPRLQKIAVEGLNEAGEVVDRDELLLNAGAQRFAVRLLDPRPGKTYRNSLRARVQVEPPSGERVERVELWFNEERVATLYQPPYAHPILLPKGKEIGYVRAVAFLADGRAAEDLVLLNAPDAPEQMAVRLVELFTSVVDPSGRPAQNVDPRVFAVYEDGVPQRVRLAEPVGETPIRVVTLIDNSLSMRENLSETRQAALQFLRRTLRPADQASVITFNRTPRVAVRLTNDLEELEEGLTGLLAEDQTSLYDSLAFSLQYLSGVKGQRAVLLLSDGLDRTSRLSFEQTVECARRAGIAVYAIGLGLERGGRGEAGEKLSQMARETGGRSFFVENTSQLDGVYSQIERDLRSQYRIAYQSSNNRTDDQFRAVKVEVAGKGMEARTISGYYP